jgi:hypothetical protein
MMQAIVKCIGLIGLAGCIADGGHRSDVITVTQANSLGVTTLQADRVEQDGNSVYTLRGLSAGGQQVASVRLTLGEIPDLAQIAGGGTNFGSEIVVLIGDNDPVRTVSHETRLLQIRPWTPALTQFLDIPAVVSALSVQANIAVMALNPAGTGEEAYTFFYQACPASYLLSSPVADQACFGGEYTLGVHNLPVYSEEFTLFVRPSDNMVVTRQRNVTYTGTPQITGEPCTNGSGSDTGCGSACIYGPQGFAKGSFTSFGANPVITDLNSVCNGSSSGTVFFGNVTGTNPTGQGCPGSSQGFGDWDY